MKKLLCLCAVLILTFATVSALAATDVTGAWTGQFTSTDGNVVMPLSCTLKQDGTKLTGSFSSSRDGEPIIIPITDGTIDGDKISFNITVNGMVIHHQGTVDGDDIKLASTSDTEDFPGGTMTLKRTKPPASTPAV